MSRLFKRSPGWPKSMTREELKQKFPDSPLLKSCYGMETEREFVFNPKFSFTGKRLPATELKPNIDTNVRLA